VLWHSSEPVTPAALNEALRGDLAYATVMTVLSRLWKTGLLERVPRAGPLPAGLR
jgi:predicted transcriptional regulator